MSDPARADFWDSRYREGVIPWDAGRVPLDLQGFARTLPQSARVLIPGCGSAYEAYFLAEAGLDVLAIDFSAEAVQAAQRNLGNFADRVQRADFFTFDYGPPFDVLYERAFLCALPRKLWPDYATRVAQLLRPGGLLAGYFFYHDNLRGPPFGTSEAQLHALLDGDFEPIEDRAAPDSIEVFRDRERWQVWRRR